MIVVYLNINLIRSNALNLSALIQITLNDCYLNLIAPKKKVLSAEQSCAISHSILMLSIL